VEELLHLLVVLEGPNGVCEHRWEEADEGFFVVIVESVELDAKSVH